MIEKLFSVSSLDWSIMDPNEIFKSINCAEKQKALLGYLELFERLIHIQIKPRCV